MTRAQTPADVAMHVDGTAAGTPLEPVWAFYGYDEANYTTTDDGRALLRTLAAIHPSPVRARTHFLFNTGDGLPALKWGSTNVYTEDAEGNPVYDYTLIDSILDATLEAGALPLVELGFMPQALSARPLPYQNTSTYALDGGSFYPPRDYQRWGQLVSEWASHVKQRYPGAEASWQWELWNEPDIGYWHGTFAEFARLYDVTEAALHAVFPGTSLGGPAVANAASNFLAQFLEHCATGTNAVSGQTGTRLDMVSFHAKGGVRLTNGHVQMDLGNQLRLHRAGFQQVASSAAFAHTPIVISEADPDGCAACPLSTAPQHAYRNSPAYGAYEVAMMKRSLDLAAELEVNLRGVLTWAFTFPGSPYFAGYRALTTNGIHLPVLNAFKLLGRLRGERLPVLSSAALPMDELLSQGVRERPDIDALAARAGNQIEILVWHYHDDLLPAPSAAVTLEVAVPPAWGANVSVTHTRVDGTNGDAHAVWVAQGSPEAPSAEQIAALRAAMEPGVLDANRALEAQSGTLRLSFELPRFGLSLFTLQPASERAPQGTGGASCAQAGASPARDSTQLLPVGLALASAALCARRRPGSRIRSQGGRRALPLEKSQ